VPTQVFDGDLGLQAAVAQFDRPDSDASCFRLQMGHGPHGGRFQLLGQCRDVKLVAKTVQQALHEEISAQEYVAGNPRRGLPITPLMGDSPFTTGMWQFWQLCFSRYAL